ncbi:MAG: alanine--glyoxylate aminotransferase family protein [bacterium]|nr:alanine--glyoxylate aminotransferase family protein [bacterium]
MKQYLFTPGPTPIPNEVLKEQATDLVHHRKKRYKEIYGEVVTNIKPFIGTDNDVFLITGSGTSAMEAAVANIVSPGDNVLVVRCGFFGNRWYDICKAFGANVRSVDVEWGRAVNPRVVEQRLQENEGGAVKAVFATFVDTSTGVISDIEEIGGILKDFETLFVVDAISGLGAVKYEMDKWNVDVTVTASQKSFMSPPGISFIALSDDAWSVSDSCKGARYYFDLRRHRVKYDAFEPPYTPAISTVYAIHKALEIMHEETPKAIFARHERLGRATRAAITTLGFQVFAMNPADVLTVVRPGDESGIDPDALRDHLARKYNVLFAGGQGPLMNQIFRIGHMGAVDSFDIVTAIAALEMTLADLGHSVEPGAGLAAATEVLRGK